MRISLFFDLHGTPGSDKEDVGALADTEAHSQSRTDIASDIIILIIFGY